ncbi:MAG: histidine--tRNA ligase [Candidatus Doudnabacteria bacterium]|nr:histidine--tRNA ligase [Candidatus Doudnabacteria bacterium]
MSKIQLLKGFRDYLPQEQMARKKIISKVSEVFERFGFAPLDTPAMEYYDLLGGKYGEEGEKLMYKFEDQGGRMVALRYDLTVPLSRVVASNPDLSKPFKRYQIANVWRAENPQKGRFREFMQCDVDIVGSSSLIADAEVIATINSAFKSLEIGEVLVKFNSRQLADKVLSEIKIKKSNVIKFIRAVDKLEKQGEKKVVELLQEQGMDSGVLKKYRQLMGQEGKGFAEEMEELLSGFGVENMEFSPNLMRGLDYYTGTVFEFVLKEKPEFGSIAGGGRYDNLIKDSKGQAIPAVGCSIGLDRLLAALMDAGLVAPQTAAEVIVFNLDKNLVPEYLNIATNLREAGLDTEFYFETAKLDKQFKYAEAKNIQVAIIYGPNEAKARRVNVKNLKEKEQVTVDLDDLATQIKSMLW